MRSASTILVLLSLEYRYAREAALGIRQFALGRGGWQLRVARPDVDEVAAWRARRRELFGVVGFLANPEVEKAVAALRVPAVNIAGRAPATHLPRVLPDNLAVGRLAAEHLRARGFRHLAYVAQQERPPDLERQHGFTAALRAAGLTARVHRWSGDRAFCRWLAGQPRPLGLMAVNDVAARDVLAACLAAGVQVPGEVAIVGAENSEIHCELAPVSLSSVETEGRRVGYEAAVLLDRLRRDQLRRGRRPRGSGPREPLRAPGVTRVPVVTVVARQSTDIIAVDDAAVAKALDFIRMHACDPAGVQDVLDHVAMARRTLEKRFRAVLGRSPHQEIQRVRLERARELLAGSDLKVSEVARRCGFARPRHFMAAFRQGVDLTPSAFRSRHRRV